MGCIQPTGVALERVPSMSRSREVSTRVGGQATRRGRLGSNASSDEGDDVVGRSLRAVLRVQHRPCRGTRRSVRFSSVGGTPFVAVGRSRLRRACVACGKPGTLATDHCLCLRSGLTRLPFRRNWRRKGSQSCRRAATCSLANDVRPRRRPAARRLGAHSGQAIWRPVGRQPYADRENPVSHRAQAAEALGEVAQGQRRLVCQGRAAAVAHVG
jgi:hypothetical protein